MLSRYLIVLGIILINSLVYGKNLLDECPSAISPINILAYSLGTNIKYPSYPKVAINTTTYAPLSLKKFMKDDADNTQISLSCPDLGKLHIKVYNYSIAYNVKKIYLKVFAEHALEGNMADLELQIMHELDPFSTYQFLRLHDIDNDFNMEDYKYAGISIRFSANRNIKSKDKFIEQLSQCSRGGDVCEFNSIEFVDLNQYFRKDYSYYHYQGTGTTKKTCNDTVQWFVIQNVQDMERDEFNDLMETVAYQRNSQNDLTGTAYSYNLANNNDTIVTYVKKMKEEKENQ